MHDIHHGFWSKSILLGWFGQKLTSILFTVRCAQLILTAAHMLSHMLSWSRQLFANKCHDNIKQSFHIVQMKFFFVFILFSIVCSWKKREQRLLQTYDCFLYNFPSFNMQKLTRKHVSHFTVFGLNSFGMVFISINETKERKRNTEREIHFAIGIIIILCAVFGIYSRICTKSTKRFITHVHSESIICMLDCFVSFKTSGS